MEIKKNTNDLAQAAAGVAALGSEAGALALVSLSLDEQRSQTRAARREAQRAEEAAFERQLDELESKAVATLVGGLGSAAGQLGSAAVHFGDATRASGALDAASSSGDAATVGLNGSTALLSNLRGSEHFAELSRAGGSIQQAVADFSANGHDMEAKRYEHDSSAAKSAAEDLRDADADLRSYADRASSHLDAVAKARMEALLAASRG